VSTRAIAAKSRGVPAGVTPQGFFRSPTFLYGALVVVATLVLYFPVSHHPFADFDDPAYVVNNPHIASGLNSETISWAFTTFYQFNWHPLTWISHALDVGLFHMDPAGHHVMNMLLHVANVLLLYLVLLRATGYPGRSAMVAGLFALHPMNVESVAWISERKNLLSMFFFLLGMRTYAWYASATMEEQHANRKSWGSFEPEPRIHVIHYAVMASVFALGLMAKPQLVTFPFILLLWDYWPLGRMAPPKGELVPGTLLDPVVPARSFWWLVKEKLPLFAICAASAGVTIAAQQAGGAMASLQRYPLSVRLTNAVVCYSRYLQKAIWPTRLAPLYPHPWEPLPLWQVGLSLLFLLAITALLILARHKRYLLVGWLWFLCTLVPMSGIVQVGNQAMADRYAYFPFVGLFIMVCWTMGEIADELEIPMVAVRCVVTLVLLAAFIVADRQLGYWDNNIDLWRHTLAVTNDNYIAHDNLGRLLMLDGREDEALQNYHAALALYPPDPFANLALAAYAQQHGNFQDAINRYYRVIGGTLDRPARADIFTRIGLVYLDMGDVTNAEESFRKAIALDGNCVQGWLGLGVIAEQAGDLQQAVSDYQQANSARPTRVAYTLLARALEKRGDATGAQEARRDATLLPSDERTAQTFSGGILQK